MISVHMEDASARWAAVLRDWAPDFLKEHAVLSNPVCAGSLLLHGSTTLGIDDTFSDLDLWLLVDQSAISYVESSAGTRFFPFKVDGKEGHVNVHTLAEFQQRVSRCDFPLIAELGRAEILVDRDGSRISPLLDLARQPMALSVRNAWFCYHYVMMRQAHRALDNPIDRLDAPTVLFGVSSTLEQALQAALILDGVPYPYIKWLHRAALQTPTGQRVTPAVREILELLAQDALSLPGPEKDHPLSKKLKQIRNILIGCAHEAGFHDEWLGSWWLALDIARDGIGTCTWNWEDAPSNGGNTSRTVNSALLLG